MLATIWLSFPRSSGDRVTAGDKHANFNHDKLRRNAVLLLADLVLAETAGQGRRSVYHRSIKAGPAASAKCVGGVPGQPGAGRGLWVFERGVRPHRMVGG